MRTLPAVAAAFSVLSLSLPLCAQWTEDVISEFAMSAPRFSGAAPVTGGDSLSSQKCPESPFEYSVTYPQGFDGGGPVDKAVGAAAERLLAIGRGEGEGFISSGAECESPEPAYARVGSLPFRVSSRAYSVLYSWSTYTGGAHANYGYFSQNLLADGSELTFQRLFSDSARSLPLLWEIVYKGYCGRDDNLEAPSFFGSQPCAPAVPPAPAQLSPEAASLDMAGHALLTSLGVSFHLGPYEAYSFPQGPQFLDIPKETLLKIGADQEIWR
ncbi:MAG: hypothetical protein LBW85_01700 [Deltaproteobacteria bacterium]|jgi:hypothetical protein|nr:hypothetical protein [Deltaproteobacteria bacterium]